MPMRNYKTDMNQLKFFFIYNFSVYWSLCWKEKIKKTFKGVN